MGSDEGGWPVPRGRRATSDGLGSVRVLNHRLLILNEVVYVTHVCAEPYKNGATFLYGS